MGEPQDVMAERIVRDLLMPYARNDSNATINVHGAAPWQLWLCATACVVMLAVLIVGGVIGGIWISREFARIDREFSHIDVTLSERKEEADRMQTYLSAIYAQAPQLKPKSEESDDAE